jgi:hypothetical protein
MDFTQFRTQDEFYGRIARKWKKEKKMVLLLCLCRRVVEATLVLYKKEGQYF